MNLRSSDSVARSSAVDSSAVAATVRSAAAAPLCPAGILPIHGWAIDGAPHIDAAFAAVPVDSDAAFVPANHAAADSVLTVRARSADAAHGIAASARRAESAGAAAYRASAVVVRWTHARAAGC